MDGEEWEEVLSDPTFRWKKKPKKLRLYADANVPQEIVDEIRNSGSDIPLTTAREDGAATKDDSVVRERARQHGSIVLTFDRDLWQDGKHPLFRSAGVIFVDVPNDRKEDAFDALATFYFAFAKWWPGDRWEGQKARVYVGGFVLKFLNWEGRIKEIDHRVVGSRLYAREIR